MPRLPTPEEQARRQRAELEKRARLLDFLETFSTDAGRRVYDYLESHSFQGKPIARIARTGQTDVFLTGVNEGHRQMFLVIKQHVEAGEMLSRGEKQAPRQTVAESETIRNAP